MANKLYLWPVRPPCRPREVSVLGALILIVDDDNLLRQDQHDAEQVWLTTYSVASCVLWRGDQMMRVRCVCITSAARQRFGFCRETLTLGLPFSPAA